MKVFQKLLLWRFSNEICRFFQKLILSKIVWNKGLRVKEGHILRFVKESSKNIAKLGKNDLHEFEGEKREISEIPQNFWFFPGEYQQSNYQEQNSSQFWSKLAFQSWNPGILWKWRENFVILGFSKGKFMRVIFSKFATFWIVFESFNAIMPFNASFQF